MNTATAWLVVTVDSRAGVQDNWVSCHSTQPGITGPGGALVAEGRGRRYEQHGAPGGQLAYSRVAHAEINALAGLPPTGQYEDHILLTTLEPCCMCVGAAIQSSIARLHFAGRYPYGGASALQIDTPQARRRPPVITGPLAGSCGRFAELLHVRWLIEFGASRHVLEEQLPGIPDIYQRAAQPAAEILFDRLRGDAADLDQAMAAFQELDAET
jgi:tRNA(Arg) A34 adenosine deaminase TadA